MPHGEYGYDAPYALVIFACLSAAAAVAAGFAGRAGDARLTLQLSGYTAFFLGNTLSFLYTTRRGKFIEWDRILDTLALRGDERVLDMGCGRGAVLAAVATRLTTGRAVGIDIWRAIDQSGNAKAVTERNVALEGVADRVEIETGDMRDLPFPDASFDVVVSSLAIHNIRGNSDRQKAISEAYRVLKPGGRIVVADIKTTSLYESTLRSLGASKVERRRLGWQFWWGNPIAATTLVTASK